MKRFVTYLYEYDRGNRGRNVGFVRTDIRDTFCRMEVHIRGLDRLKGKNTVYLAVEDNTPIGVPVGEIVISQGMGNLILTFPDQQIDRSGYIIDQLQSLVIRLDNGRLLAGNFVKEPVEQILMGNFRVWTPEAAARPESQTPSSPSEASPRDKTMSPGAVNPRTLEDVPGTPDTRSNLNDVPGDFTPQNNAGSPGSSAFGNNHENPVAPDLRNNPNSQGKSYFRTDAVPPRVSTIQDGKNSTENPAPTNTEDVSTIQTSENHRQISKPAIQEIAHESAATTPAPDTPQPEVSYRRIELTDIRSLPRRNWYLSNNRFVVHGFFNYHYLLLKTVLLPEGRKRFLGVPGIYEQPERMMALLFGFPEFELSEESKASHPQKAEDLTGAFGYWMCQVAEE